MAKWRRVVVALVTLCAFLSLAASPASAARPFLGQLTEANGAPLVGPWGLAVDEADNVWVAATGQSLVHKFDSSGGFLAQSSGEGRFSSLARSVAFSNASSRLYVSDSNLDDVWVLDSAGAYITGLTGPWGAGCCFVYVAADNSGGSTDGAVFISSTNGTVYRVDGSGAPSDFSGTAPYIEANRLGGPSGGFVDIQGISVDANGNIYVLDTGVGVETVYQFDSSGVFVQSFQGGSGGPFGDISGVAADPATGNVLIVDRGNGVIEEFDSGGNHLQQITDSEVPGGFGTLRSVAVNSEGLVYVTDDSNDVVHLFGSTAILPRITPTPITNDTRTSATLNAHVDLNGGGDVSECFFEYGTSSSYGQVAACDPPAPLTGSVAVHADIAGLIPETTYRYRLVARNPNGLGKGQSRTYTPRAVFGVDTGTATDLVGPTATLRGSFDPDGFATSYYFEYGLTTAYGQKTAVPPGDDGGAGTGTANVQTPISGLTSDTLYHYRLVATNQFGTTLGQDRFFKTPKAPRVQSTSSKELSSDSAVLTTIVNPENAQTTVRFEYGTNTAYGAMTPESAPIGSDNLDHAASAAIDGLEPGTVYHFRVRATSSAGITIGPDRMFTTVPLLPSIESSSVDKVSRTSARLNAEVKPGFASTIVAFQYGRDSSYGSLATVLHPVGSDNTSRSASVEVSGLEGGVTYHYRVLATNFGGTTVGTDRTFTTPELPRLGATTSSDSTFMTAQSPSAVSVPPRRTCRKGTVRKRGKCVKARKKQRARKGGRSDA